MGERQKPLGVIDSGVGGLSVVEALRQLVPSRDIVYVADPLHFPYGEKSKDDLIVLVRSLIFFLESLNVETVITACGTVSSLCLDDLRKEFLIPIVGILEPTCREALRVTRNKKILVLATNATVKAGSFRNAIKILDPKVEVCEEAWPELIEAVERGTFYTQEWKEWVEEKLSFFYSQGVDTVILGCTHFALVSWFFEELARGRFLVVNPAKECALRVGESLGMENLDGSSKGRTLIFVRGDTILFQKTVRRIPLSLETFELASFPVSLNSSPNFVR
ncbi:MAG: glutamate racemase [Candidatus Caldatribacteriaceae bacterium]